jgi:hypothetical protein
VRPGNGMVASEVMTAEVASYQSKSTYHDSCLSSSLTQRYHPRISPVIGPWRAMQSRCTRDDYFAK